MCAYCIDEETKAVEGLRLQRQDGVSSEVFWQIREKAAEEWPEDFGMRLHTENEQLEAYRKLHPRTECLSELHNIESSRRLYC